MIRSEPIGNCVVPVESRDPARDKPGGTFRYIDLSSVDKDRKVIDTSLVQEIESQDAPSRARQLVNSGDILVSTVRPNLNGIAVVPDELDGATASTGYCVLRCNERLDPLYLYYWVQTPDFVSDMVRKAIGANYPAVTDRVIKTSPIPLPPLATQKLIARVLEQADQLRKQAQQMESELNQLAQSLFLEMFGDPVRNPKKWPVQAIQNVCKKITDGEHLNPTFVESGRPMVMAANVQEVGVDITATKKITESDLAKFRKKCNPEVGDILLVSRGATIGRCCAVDSQEAFALMGSVILIKPLSDLVTSDYLLALLRTSAYRGKLYNTSSASAQQAIYLSHVKSLAIPTPPHVEQMRHQEFSVQIQHRISEVRKMQQKYETLFNALMQRAFNGELTAPQRKAA